MARWICHPEDGREARLVPVFRRRFTVRQGLKTASLRLTSHGVYEAELNGMHVTADRFTPGLTSYYARIQVQEYDAFPFLVKGDNELRVTVGDGWWRWNNNFGYKLALWGELTLRYEDGGVEIIATDERFEVVTGPVVRTDLQKGELYDARIEPQGWQSAVLCSEHIEGALIENQSVPVHEKERFAGKPLRDSAGNLVVDFGQNIAGYVHMTLRNTHPGQVVHLKHGEGLDGNGAFSTANCDGGRDEFQEVTYICKGAEAEEYIPHFAVFGFRYALVEGIEDADFEAIAVYSDMDEVGEFRCSNELINKLVENARWSQKGNFLDVPVDCPTRERNAWTGDAMIYCRTAAYFMDVRQFFKKWLPDQTLEQYASGKVGITFPSTSSVHNPEELEAARTVNPAAALAGPTGDGNIGEDSVGWGDSAVWIPYQMYLMYGDRGFLEEHYETAKRWVEFSLNCMQERNPLYADKLWYAQGDGDLIYDTRFHYGEWNEPLPPAPEVIELFASGGTAADYVTHMAKYGKPEVATAYTKRSCDNLAHMARILGREEDAGHYSALAERIKAAYDKYLICPDGTIQPGHQAAYVRALALDMVGEAKRPLVIAQLKKELEAAGYHLNTGFLSTVYLLPTLCENGLVDEAFRILEQTDAPSWLHPITLGATTMLENWDSMDMFRDSFNHYSFGAVCQFLFEYVAGIRPTFDAPGFKEFELKPVIGGHLTWAEASYRTSHGPIRSRWELQGESLRFTCTVPEGTVAHLTLPSGRTETLPGGDYRFEEVLNG
ncbi:MAG: family 78 glycoside hydrolase catalytic domain [Atopobiaceae bacterium]|nr:family 78 glycoside hydrolase catalytic domain [Atopobiaceae bacterium]MBQ6523977.1 family 78 glycoside hydrolase catalytic domain [Atopobiaceae bacterium]